MMDQIKRLLARLPGRQKITIALSTVAVAAGLWGLVRWNHERGFEPLYLGLAPEDAAAVVEHLRASSVEYRLADGGSTIKVAARQAAESRLIVAGAGLPKTGRMGFELFDTTNLGMTEFAEQVNYRRAIEGELERSIMSLREIERARVHISLAKESVFVESREEAKASVLVKLRPRSDLSAQNASAICHLVAAAVGRLSPRNVTVIDTEGRLLVRPQLVIGGIVDSAADGLLEYRQQLERDLLRKINQTVEPLVGPENFRAGVSIDCDLAATEQSAETFDPARSVLQNSQKSVDLASPAQPAPTAPQPLRGGPGVARRTESATYQTSRTVVHTKQPQGAVKRVSIAVLVGQTVRWEGTGAKARRIVEPPPPATLNTIRSLVAAAAGFSKERGDTLTVETLPFDARRMEAPPDPFVPPGEPSGFDRVAGFPLGVKIGVGLAILLVVLLPLAWIVMRREPGGPSWAAAISSAGIAAGALPDAEGKSIEQGAADREAERHRRDAATLGQLSLPRIETPRGDLLAKLIRDKAKADPAATARLLEGWMDEHA